MRRPRDSLAIALAAAIGAPACGDGAPPARGFHSRQLLSSREPTLSLAGFGTKLIPAQGPNGPYTYYGTDPDIAYYSTGESPAETYWQVSLPDNVVTELGPQIPPLPTSTETPVRYACRYESVGSSSYTMVIVDPVSGQDLTSIDRVMGLGGCARYPDGFLAVVRLDDAGVGRLWTGRFDELVQANIDLAIAAEISDDWSLQTDPTMWSMRVVAAQATAGNGIYDINLSTLTTTELIPPRLATLTWTDGSTPSAATGSDGLTASKVTTTYLSGGGRYYFYGRHMNDGDDVMFVSTLSPPAPPELALFSITGDTWPVSFATVRFGTLASLTAWQQAAAPGADTEWLLTWDVVAQHLVSCPLAAGTLPPVVSGLGYTRMMVAASPDDSRYAFADAGALGQDSGELYGPLIALSLAGSGSCDLLAAKDVKRVAIDNDAVAWIESPRGGGEDSLWLAGAPGSAPREIGSMTTISAPIFVAPDTLQIEMGTDLGWLDVRDDPVKMHYVAERVFGRPSTGARWLVTGYDLSTQDGTGTLGVVDWRFGQKRAISPAVADFMVSSDQSGVRPLDVVYLVRGRGASSQDGIWAATIDAADLP